jgi:uncharacterized protein YbjT (DUF2867 family)
MNVHALSRLATFFVSGATGTVGATGRKTVELPLERGYQVRAFVYQHDESQVRSQMNITRS